MSRYRKLSIAVLIAAFLTLVVVLCASAPSSLAYTAGDRWGGTPIYFQIDPNLDDLLGLLGADSPAAIRATADKWTQASYFTLGSTGGYDPMGARTVTAADLTDGNSDTCQENSGIWARVCWLSAGGRLVSTKMYLNNHPDMRWNMRGLVAEDGSGFRDADVRALALHEFGHFIFLADHPPGHAEAVMDFQTTADGSIIKRDLLEDDKQGATMLYGPYTSWEDGEASGQIDWLAFSANVTGYSAGIPPQLGPTDLAADGVGVPVQSGIKYARMAGSATTQNSFAYFNVFTSEDDTSGTALPFRGYVQITQGMTLHWCQYNWQQDTMAVDFEMVDGQGNITTLRDSGLRDQNGILVHPAARRGAYLMQQWNCFDVGLTPLAGRKITRWLIAYDNSNSGTIGQFRAYFDNLQLLPPLAAQGQTIIPGGGPVPVTITTPGQSAQLTFNGSIGQRVSLQLTNGTFPNCSSTIGINKPDGSTLGSTGCLSSFGFLDALTLPATGSYTVFVNPGGATGSGTLTLYNAADVTGLITPGGAAVPVNITTPGQNALLNFGGSPGEQVSLNLTGGTFTSCGLRVSILNPNGTTLASNTCVEAGGFINATSLPSAGTYTILIDPQGPNTGSVTATLYNAGQAAFAAIDTATQGNWKGVYGGDGYNVLGDTVSYPGYATVSAGGTGTFVFAGSTIETRALQKAGSDSDRVAACWYSASGFDIDVNLAGGTRRVALYALDWDAWNGPRSETVQVLDAATNAVLDSRSISSFTGGVYLVWDIGGHVRIRVINTTGPSNAVVSGLFFGGGGAGQGGSPNLIDVSIHGLTDATLEPEPRLGWSLAPARSRWILRRPAPAA